MRFQPLPYCRTAGCRPITAAVCALAIALGGCGTRGAITLTEGGTAARATAMEVLVATPRAAAPAPEYFSGARDFVTNYARFDVSIPPDRKPGTIRYPRGRADPETDFLVTEAERLAGPQDFVRAVNGASAKSGGDSGLLFVHGFNTNFAESLFKEAQLRHDLQSPGMGVLFSWPSDAKLLAYPNDRENALFSRDALAETLRLMARSNLDGYNLVAHSMGTFLVMETLRTMALAGERRALDRIHALVLISADIEVDVFRRQVAPVLAAGVPVYILVSDDDRALRVSAALRGDRRRVGSVRSAAELGGIDVSVVDLSAIDSGDGTRHMKIGTSPELIAFVQRIRRSGVAIFDDGQKTGLLDAGAVVLQGATGVILQPLAN